MPRLFHVIGEGLELGLGNAAGAVRATGSREGESETRCGRSKADEIHGKDHDKDTDKNEDKDKPPRAATAKDEEPPPRTTTTTRRTHERDGDTNDATTPTRNVDDFAPVKRKSQPAWHLRASGWDAELVMFSGLSAHLDAARDSLRIVVESPDQADADVAVTMLQGVRDRPGEAAVVVRDKDGDETVPGAVGNKVIIQRVRRLVVEHGEGSVAPAIVPKAPHANVLCTMSTIVISCSRPHARAIKTA